jgi:NAD(P)-dependent dehydrogenase (short-subunit alcohol dehydrogenase family)
MQTKRSGSSIDLTSQVALVTGGGRGLGRAFAHALAGAGAAVAVTARSAGELTKTAAEITAGRGRTLAVPADVSDRKAITQLVQTVEQQLGPVDLLVNNAGVVSPLGPLWQNDPDEWWRTMEINVRGALLCSHAVLPAMLQRGRGRIINVASAAGTRPIPFGSAYVTSKAALIRFTETLASETGEYGIPVFAIHPGTVRTDMAHYLLDSAPGQQWMPWFRTIFEEEQDTPAEDAVKLVLRLAAGHADALSGCYIDVEDDLDDLVQRAEEIASNDLYALRVRTF